MFGLAAYVPEVVERAPLLPMSARVRVKEGWLEGVGTVRIPLIPKCLYARIGVEFDDAPGFVWQVERSNVEPA